MIGLKRGTLKQTNICFPWKKMEKVDNHLQKCLERGHFFKGEVKTSKL